MNRMIVRCQDTESAANVGLLRDATSSFKQRQDRIPRPAFAGMR